MRGQVERSQREGVGLQVAECEGLVNLADEIGCVAAPGEQDDGSAYSSLLLENRGQATG